MAVPAVYLLQDSLGATHGAGGVPVRVIGDSLAAAVGMIRDTIPESPLPGGVAELVRFIFRVPQWIQIAGAVVAALVGLWVAWWAWGHRMALLGWLRSRSREIQFGLAAAALLAVSGAGFAGMKSWDYMQHDNGFCTGCHVMETPFHRFGEGAGKHEKLECHDCHQQSIFASTRQLVLWVAERPGEIGKHAPLKNATCEACHSKGADATERWERVRQLAGHRVHFESDSSALKDLQCVTCHGAEVHRFIPSARTCQQSGCHENQGIKLGKMADLPEINCALCHDFRKEIPALATTDSARLALVPIEKQCTSCHEMAAKLPGYRPERDPHNGNCGSCHDLHQDSIPSDARDRCATCHENLETSPFHTGPNHKGVAKDCLTCHTPHAASVDASDCVGCHREVQKQGKMKAPLPFDTNSVIRKRVSASHVQLFPDSTVAPSDEPERGKGDVLPREDPPPGPSHDGPPPFLPVVPADTFPHARHTSIACIGCHVLTGDGGKLVFETPRGCDLCHHQALMAGKVNATECSRCHRDATLATPRPTPVSITVKEQPARLRTVLFAHDAHAPLRCADCHQPPSTMPPDSVRTCSGCHVPHHDAARDCAACHGAVTTLPEVRVAHARETHMACDKCHQGAVIAQLVPNRTFCLSCHAAQRTHEPMGECATCHFLASPESYRSHLRSSSGGSP